MSRFLLVFLSLLLSNVVYPEGFGTGTLVRTPIGYKSIENVSVGDVVMCYDFENNLVTRPVVRIAKQHVTQYVCLKTGGEYINVVGTQKLYSVTDGAWVTVENVNLLHDFLVEEHTCQIESITLVNEPIDLYLLSIAEYHNFFVSRINLCAHNIFPIVVLGISAAFGSGAIEVIGVSCGLAGLGTYLGYQWHKNKHNQAHITMISVAGGGGMMPEDPEEKKKQRDQASKTYRSLNNKEARELAQQHGYREVRDHPCGDTRNQPVFTDGKTYISADADGHNGGVWKVFSRRGRRLGTWNRDLTKNIGS